MFEDFAPKLSERSRSSDVLFLANIQPELQLRGPRAAAAGALRRARLDEPVDRHRARRAGRGDPERRLRDPQRRRAAPADRQAEPGLGRARGALLGRRRERPDARRGPSVVVAKQGEYGAALITRESFFALPAYPLETVIDPTGAGDTFAGGLVGYIAAHPGEELSDELLRRAMAHATVLASFNVEEFGTERVARLTGEEIVARIHELHAMTQFSGAPLTLRG